MADREAEDLISRGLRGLLNVPVVGEEAAAADLGLLTALREADDDRPGLLLAADAPTWHAARTLLLG